MSQDLTPWDNHHACAIKGPDRAGNDRVLGVNGIRSSVGISDYTRTEPT